MLLRPVLFLGRTRVVNPGKDASYTPKIPLRAYQGKSRYAWAFLPDLRGSRVQPGTQDEEQKKRDWFYVADPDVLEARFVDCLKFAADRLPNGGIREGVVAKFMRIATRPRHIRLAIQIISLHQNRDPTQVVASETVTHLITASIRLGCPELAVSFLTLPWVRVNPTAKNIEMLLELYADLASEIAIHSFARGEGLTVQPIVELQANGLIEGEDVAEQEDEEEEDEGEVAGADSNPSYLGLPKAKRQLYTQMIDSFMSLYQELRSRRHIWKITSRMLNSICRFYASLGDPQKALQKVDSDDSVYHIRQRSLRIPDILASDVDAVVANYRKYGNIQTFEHKESAVVLTFATKEEAEVASKADNRAKLLHYGSIRLSPKTVSALKLALVYTGMASQANDYPYTVFTRNKPEAIRARLATYLALGDRDAVFRQLEYSLQKNFPLEVAHLECHFGIPGRKRMLVDVYRDLKQTGMAFSDEKDLYLESLSPIDEEELGVGQVEGEGIEGEEE